MHLDAHALQELLNSLVISQSENVHLLREAWHEHAFLGMCVALLHTCIGLLSSCLSEELPQKSRLSAANGCCQPCPARTLCLLLALFKDLDLLQCSQHADFGPWCSSSAAPLLRRLLWLLLQLLLLLLFLPSADTIILPSLPPVRYFSANPSPSLFRQRW